MRSDGTLEALVSEAFAQAHRLQPGARLNALINGKQRTLVIVGTALSPEFIFAGLWGMPDTRGFGIFWVDREALAAAYDMQGAFNRVALKLAPGASEPAAIDGVTRLLSAYGGREAHGRTEQTSHAMLDNEIKEQRVLGTVLPAIFLAVAAFLLNVVVSRLVSTQREQIAALKALGYPNRAIGAALPQARAADRAARRCCSALRWAIGWATHVHRPVRRVLPLPELRAPHRAVAAGHERRHHGRHRRRSAPSTPSPPPCGCRPPRRCGRRRRATTGARCWSGSASSAMAPALRMIVRNMERRPLRTRPRDRRCRRRRGDRDHGQLLPRCDRRHRRHAVHARPARRHDGVDRRTGRRRRARSSSRGCPA